MTKRICSVPDCGRKSNCRYGWCQGHFERWLRHGDIRADIPIRQLRPRLPTLEAVFRYHMPEEPPSAGIIWSWRGRLDKNGYGELDFLGRTFRAHRVAYEIFREPIPPGLVIRHMNDVPHDVNPWNMTVGTQAENIADMIARGRSAPGLIRAETIRGMKNYHTHLSEDDVYEMRRLWMAGESTQAALARRFDIRIQTVNKIVHRQTWKHI